MLWLSLKSAGTYLLIKAVVALLNPCRTLSSKSCDWSGVEPWTISGQPSGQHFAIVGSILQGSKCCLAKLVYTCMVFMQSWQPE